MSEQMSLTLDSQRQMIHQHLKRGSITARQASRLYQVDRLAARINDLRRSGVSIVTETVSENGKRFGKYSLCK